MKIISINTVALLPIVRRNIEFTLRHEDYAALGGHMDRVRRVEEVLTPEIRRVGS